MECTSDGCNRTLPTNPYVDWECPRLCKECMKRGGMVPDTQTGVVRVLKTRAVNFLRSIDRLDLAEKNDISEEDVVEIKKLTKGANIGWLYTKRPTRWIQSIPCMVHDCVLTRCSCLSATTWQ